MTRSVYVQQYARTCRAKRTDLARRLRIARNAIQNGSADTSYTGFIEQYRHVTHNHGHLYPNPNRAASCKAYANHSRKVEADFLAALPGSLGTPEAQEVLSAVRFNVELYEALASQASH